MLAKTDTNTGLFIKDKGRKANFRKEGIPVLSMEIFKYLGSQHKQKKKTIVTQLSDKRQFLLYTGKRKETLCMR